MRQYDQFCKESDVISDKVIKASNNTTLRWMIQRENCKVMARKTMVWCPNSFYIYVYISYPRNTHKIYYFTLGCFMTKYFIFYYILNILKWTPVVMKGDQAAVSPESHDILLHIVC